MGSMTVLEEDIVGVKAGVGGKEAQLSATTIVSRGEG
jgi:hypothetical protein